MNTNSNSYTIIYASVMVVIVAFLLAFVSSSLRETQNKNVELDTKKQILAALNIKDVKDAEAEYNKYVKGDMLMNVDGTYSWQRLTVRRNMYFPFTVPVFGALSGDMLH